MPIQKGRKTIFNNVYRTKSLSTTTEEIIKSNDDLIKILSEEFNITISLCSKRPAVFDRLYIK